MALCLVKSLVERQGFDPQDQMHHYVPGMAMTDVYLVSCVGKKQPRAVAARELYLSDWFRKARAYVEATGAPWFILSAEHGLLDPSTVISPYDRTLNAMSVADRRAWAATVLDQLKEVLHETDDVVIFAGQRYRKFLLDGLRPMCRRVDVPLAGLGIGQQLQWFTQQQPR